jgi:hypothetical protein
MGVDFSHCDAHWAYSGFNRFRTRLAKEIGFDLDSMEGFGGTTKWETMADPIKALLNHSDCDGKLTPKECRQVAPRLRELVKNWDDDHDKRNALELADGMESAAKESKSLQFR